MDEQVTSSKRQDVPLSSTRMLASPACQAKFIAIRSKLTATSSENIIHATKLFLEGCQDLQLIITGPECDSQTALLIIDLVGAALEHIWYRVCAPSTSTSSHDIDGPLIKRQFETLGSLLNLIIYYKDTLGSQKNEEADELVLEEAIRGLYKLLSLLWCYRLCLQWIDIPTAILTHPLPNWKLYNDAEDFLSHGSDDHWSEVLIELWKDPREGSESEGVFGDLLLSVLPQHKRASVVTSRHGKPSDVSPRSLRQVDSTLAPLDLESEEMVVVAKAGLLMDYSDLPRPLGSCSKLLSPAQNTGMKQGGELERNLQLPVVLRSESPPEIVAAELFDVVNRFTQKLAATVDDVRPENAAEPVSTLEGTSQLIPHQEPQSINILSSLDEEQDTAKHESFGLTPKTSAQRMTDLQQEVDLPEQAEDMDVDVGPTRENRSSSGCLVSEASMTPELRNSSQMAGIHVTSAAAQQCKSAPIGFATGILVNPLVIAETQALAETKPGEMMMDIDMRVAEVPLEAPSKLSSDLTTGESNCKQEQMDIDVQPAELHPVKEKSLLEKSAISFASCLHDLPADTKSCNTEPEDSPEDSPVTVTKPNMQEKRPVEVRTICSAVPAGNGSSTSLVFELSRRNLDWVQLGGRLFLTLRSKVKEVESAYRRRSDETVILRVSANSKTMIIWRSHMPSRSGDFLDITPYIQIGKNVILISGHALTNKFLLEVVSA